MANPTYAEGDAICKRCGEPLVQTSAWVHKAFGFVRIEPRRTRTFYNGYDHLPEPARTGDKDV